MKLTSTELRESKRIYDDCLRKGHSPRYAVRLAAAAVSRQVGRRTGLGDELPAAAFEPALAPEKNIIQKVAEHETVAAIRATVSPWLWVTSLVSFGMALVNRKQIAVMFGKWKHRNQSKG